VPDAQLGYEGEDEGDARDYQTQKSQLAEESLGILHEDDGAAQAGKTEVAGVAPPDFETQERQGAPGETLPAGAVDDGGTAARARTPGARGSRRFRRGHGRGCGKKVHGEGSGNRMAL
jgi:hypothetical protein